MFGVRSASNCRPRLEWVCCGRRQLGMLPIPPCPSCSIEPRSQGPHAISEPVDEVRLGLVAQRSCKRLAPAPVAPFFNTPGGFWGTAGGSGKRGNTCGSTDSVFFSPRRRFKVTVLFFAGGTQQQTKSLQETLSACSWLPRSGLVGAVC